MGMGGEGEKEWVAWHCSALQPGKTEEGADHHQNNNHVKAVGTSLLWSD